MYPSWRNSLSTNDLHRRPPKRPYSSPTSTRRHFLAVTPFPPTPCSFLPTFSKFRHLRSNNPPSSRNVPSQYLHSCHLARRVIPSRRPITIRISTTIPRRPPRINVSSCATRPSPYLPTRWFPAGKTGMSWGIRRHFISVALLGRGGGMARYCALFCPDNRHTGHA